MPLSAVSSVVLCGGIERVDSVALIQWDKLGEIALSWILSPVFWAASFPICCFHELRKRFGLQLLGR